MRPEPRRTTSDWADKYRKLTSKSSAEPGPYRTDRAPYNREIQDNLSIHSPVVKTVVMKGSQLGLSEVGNNWMGYIVDHAPAPSMAVQPTVELGKRFSRQRFDSLVQSTKRVGEKIKPARSRDSGNTVLSKEFPGGIWIITGANSAAGLRSMPVKNLFLDEVDAYPDDVDGEGDPVALAEARLETFGWRAKEFMISTPLIKGHSKIEYEWSQGDQRYFYVPCPFCDHFQVLKFENFRWEPGKPSTVMYHCESCGAGFKEVYKSRMLRRGEWRATKTPEDPNVRSYQISALYAPLGWMSWAKIIRRYERAGRNRRRLQAFWNTILGLPYEDENATPDWQELYEQRDQSYTMGAEHIPDGVRMVIGAADVQRDRIEIDIWGFGRGCQSWLLDHIVLWGNPSTLLLQMNENELDKVLAKKYVHPTGAQLSIRRFAIDSGGEFTNEVYLWTRRKNPKQVLAIRGIDDQRRPAPVSGPTYVEVSVSNKKKIKRGARLWHIAVSKFKTEQYRWLNHTPPGEGEPYPYGYVHLPENVSDEWLRQLVSETQIIKPNKDGYPVAVWKKTHERNEALDMRIYARAMVWTLQADKKSDEWWDSLLPAAVRSNLAPVPVAPPPDAPPAAPAPTPPPAADTPARPELTRVPPPATMPPEVKQTRRVRRSIRSSYMS